VQNTCIRMRGPGLLLLPVILCNCWTPRSTPEIHSPLQHLSLSKGGVLPALVNNGRGFLLKQQAKVKPLQACTFRHTLWCIGQTFAFQRPSQTIIQVYEVSSNLAFYLIVELHQNDVPFPSITCGELGQGIFDGLSLK
jgi:hypothetical protein